MLLRVPCVTRIRNLPRLFPGVFEFVVNIFLCCVFLQTILLELTECTRPGNRASQKSHWALTSEFSCLVQSDDALFFPCWLFRPKVKKVIPRLSCVLVPLDLCVSLVQREKLFLPPTVVPQCRGKPFSFFFLKKNREWGRTKTGGKVWAHEGNGHANPTGSNPQLLKILSQENCKNHMHRTNTRPALTHI